MSDFLLRSKPHSRKNSLTCNIPKGLLLGLATGFLTLTSLAATSGLRQIYLNGVDISSARSQELKNVDVQISENGDVYIMAPHYQVQEEDSFVPLSQYVSGLNTPPHQQPGNIQNLKKMGSLNQADQKPVGKAGDLSSPTAASQSVKGAQPSPSEDQSNNDNGADNPPFGEGTDSKSNSPTTAKSTPGSSTSSNGPGAKGGGQPAPQADSQE